MRAIRTDHYRLQAMKQILPRDRARCPGFPAGPQLLNVAPECLTCARRLAPAHDRREMEPPKQLPCEWRIPSEEMGT